MQEFAYPKDGIWAQKADGEIHLSKDGKLVQRFPGDVTLAEVNRLWGELFGDEPSDSAD